VVAKAVGESLEPGQERLLLTCHIDVVHHFAWERVELGKVFFSFVPTKNNVADCFKALAVKPFEVCVTRMGCARVHTCTE
jgi:hypothetical protein